MSGLKLYNDTVCILHGGPSSQRKTTSGLRLQNLFARECESRPATAGPKRRSGVGQLTAVKHPEETSSRGTAHKTFASTQLAKLHVCQLRELPT